MTALTDSAFEMIDLELTMLQCDEIGILSFWEFEVPYSWLKMLLREWFDTNYKEFRHRDTYFEDAGKIYKEAKRLGIVKNCRMI